MTLLVPASLILALGSPFQATSTHCQTTDVTVVSTIVDRQLTGCGPQYSENVLWNLDRADGVSDDTAKRLTTGAGSVIYIIDFGVDQSHDEFQRAGGSTNVIAGLDPYFELGGNLCSPSDTPVHPCYQQSFAIAGQAHGTACASVAAGKTAGVAPGASIVSVRVFDVAASNGSSTFQLIFNRALDDIVKHAFDPATPPFKTAVVSMSASSNNGIVDSDYAQFEQKMKLMISGVDKDFHADPNGKKFLFVTIAGNGDLTGGSGNGQCTSSHDVALYPGVSGPAIDGLITVGGIDRNNRLWSGSCRGAAVEVLAPAERVLCASTSGHDRYRGTIGTPPLDYSSGTSYAAPYVAGIAARMLEANPNLTPIELEAMIKASPSFIDPANGTAAGGHVAVLVEAPPPPPGPKRRIVAH